MTTSKPQKLPKSFLPGLACCAISYLLIVYYGLLSWAAATCFLIAITVGFQILQVIVLRRAIKKRDAG